MARPVLLTGPAHPQGLLFCPQRLFQPLLGTLAWQGLSISPAVSFWLL